MDVSVIRIDAADLVVVWTDFMGVRGCYTDNVRERTLKARSRKGNMTPRDCAHFCKGYRYFGVEYSNEYVEHCSIIQGS